MVITIPLLFTQIKSVTVFNLTFFRHLLILVICMLAKLPITSELFELIEIITCFLDSPLVIVLILGLTGPILLLLTMLLILTAFLVCSFGKISLM